MSRPKGQKLGSRSRDNWQIMIDYYKRSGSKQMVAEYVFRRDIALFNFSFIDPYLEKHGERAGFVYLLESVNGPKKYKIGMTRNLKSRIHFYNSRYKDIGLKIRMLRHSEDCELIEKLFINLYKNKVVQGSEWFRFDDGDLEQIRKFFSL